MLLIYIMFYGAVRSSSRPSACKLADRRLPTATWLGLGGLILAGGFLYLRHARGWGTPGAWISQAEAQKRAAQTNEPTPEVQPG